METQRKYVWHAQQVCVQWYNQANDYETIIVFVQVQFILKNRIKPNKLLLKPWPSWGTTYFLFTVHALFSNSRNSKRKIFICILFLPYRHKQQQHKLMNYAPQFVSFHLHCCFLNMEMEICLKTTSRVNLCMLSDSALLQVRRMEFMFMLNKMWRRSSLLLSVVAVYVLFSGFLQKCYFDDVHRYQPN